MSKTQRFLILLGEVNFRIAFKNDTTLKPFAHFFGACKNKREVFKKRMFEKMSKRLESETKFMKIENRGVKNLLLFDDFMLRFGTQVRKSGPTA